MVDTEAVLVVDAVAAAGEAEVVVVDSWVADFSGDAVAVVAAGDTGAEAAVAVAKGGVSAFLSAVLGGLEVVQVWSLERAAGEAAGSSSAVGEDAAAAFLSSAGVAQVDAVGGVAVQPGLDAEGLSGSAGS